MKEYCLLCLKLKFDSPVLTDVLFLWNLDKQSNLLKLLDRRKVQLNSVLIQFDHLPKGIVILDIY